MKSKETKKYIENIIGKVKSYSSEELAYIEGYIYGLDKGKAINTTVAS